MQPRGSSSHLGVVLAGVRATGLLAGGSGSDRLDGVLEDVAEFEGLNEITSNISSAYA